jgi:hypothetical protein
LRITSIFKFLGPFTFLLDEISNNNDNINQKILGYSNYDGSEFEYCDESDKHSNFSDFFKNKVFSRFKRFRRQIINPERIIQIKQSEF